jgi:molybdopterin converting factor small subunit
MLVRVYAPPFADLSLLDEMGRVELPGGATLGDLLRLLHIPLRRLSVRFFTVNWKSAPLSTRLAEGDVVSFLPLLSGG